MTVDTVHTPVDVTAANRTTSIQISMTATFDSVATIRTTLPKITFPLTARESMTSPTVTARDRSWLRAVGRTGRYGTPVLVPVLVAVTSSIAGVNHGATRVYWTLGTIALTLIMATFNVIREASVRKSRQGADTTRNRTRESIAKASQPLVTLLTRVSAAKDTRKRQEEVGALINRTVAAAREQFGNGSRSIYRSSLYSLVDERLERVHFEGREGEDTPRPCFDRDDENEELREDAIRVIKYAKGESGILIEDTNNSEKNLTIGLKKETSRAVLAVPINSNENTHFGLLCVDSTEPHTLDKVDMWYMLLLAGVLAAGFVQLRRDGITVIRDGNFERRKESS